MVAQVLKTIYILVVLSLFSFGGGTVKQSCQHHDKLTSWTEIKNKNLVHQAKDYSCGSASLATILKYYYGRKKITEDKVLHRYFKLNGINPNHLEKLKDYKGLSFADLSQIAEGFGYRSTGLAVDLNTLRDVQMPVILYLRVRDDGHFSVFKGIDDMFVYLADPSFGNIRYRIDHFRKMFEDPKTKNGMILAFFSIDTNAWFDKNFMTYQRPSSLPYKIIGSRLIQR